MSVNVNLEYLIDEKIEIYSIYLRYHLYEISEKGRRVFLCVDNVVVVLT